MDDDDFSFDFESKLEEQQRNAAAETALAGVSNIPVDAAIPVNQSATSFKRNYRQTVCTYWLKGVCALGDKCGFLHEYNADRMPVCNNLLRHGVCREPDCPFKHTMDDIKECNMFKLGFCVYGPQCRYKHTRQPGPPPEPKDIDAQKLKEYRGKPGRGDMSSRGRGRSWGGGGRGPRPRPPPGEPPLAGNKRRHEYEGEMDMPPGSFGFGHGMMGMPGMMPGMMNPMHMQEMRMRQMQMQMQMGMGQRPPWAGPYNGMFPPY